MVLRQLLDTVELALEQLVLAPTRQGSSAWFQPNLKCQMGNLPRDDISSALHAGNCHQQRPTHMQQRCAKRQGVTRFCQENNHFS